METLSKQEILDTYINTKCCRQYIHKSCLDACLSLNNRCPFCRYSYCKKLNISGNYYFCDFVSVGIMIVLLFFTAWEILKEIYPYEPLMRGVYTLDK